MEFIYNKVFLEHETGNHPENKERLKVLNAPEQKVENGEKYLELIHTKKYISKVKAFCKKEMALDLDTLTSKNSYQAAIYAVGASVQASKSGDFALVRPPGHHAYPDKASGFCIFNNLAISVQRLVNQGKRVLIFDFDGHLGDGTQRIFYDTDKVLYFSIHQYPAFPGRGFVDEIGEGKGEGYTIHVPLPPNSGDDLFFDGISRVLFALKKFKPDVVALSAGFDGYLGDPLLDLKVSINAYHKLGALLKKNFSNMYAILEGGYNAKALSYCVYSFLDGINGKEQRFKDKDTVSGKDVRQEYERRMKLLDKILKKYWGGKNVASKSRKNIQS